MSTSYIKKMKKDFPIEITSMINLDFVNYLFKLKENFEKGKEKDNISFRVELKLNSFSWSDDTEFEDDQIILLDSERESAVDNYEWYKEYGNGVELLDYISNADVIYVISSTIHEIYSPKVSYGVNNNKEIDDILSKDISRFNIIKVDADNDDWNYSYNWEMMSIYKQI